MKIVEAVGAAAGGFSILTCLFVLFVALIFRKYRFPTQRIILYLNFTVLLYSIVLILHLFDHDNANTPYCVFTGFLDQQVGWYVVMAISCLTIELLRKAVFLQLKTGKLELVYLGVIFVAPFLFNWIPFTGNAYGLARATCWIKEVEYPNCTQKVPLGIACRFALYWVPFYIVLGGIFVAFVCVRVVIYRRKRAFKGQYNPSEQQFIEFLEKEISHYQWYPIIFIVWNFFPILVRAIEAVHSDETFFELRIAQVFVSGLQGAIISLAYALDYDTRMELSRPSNIKAAVFSLFTKERKVEEYHPISEPHLTDSLRQSGGESFGTISS